MYEAAGAATLLPRADVHVCTMTSPDDVSGVQHLFSNGIVDPADVVAMTVKCDGSGLPGDRTRQIAEFSLRSCIEAVLGTSAVRVSVCASGGCPPPLSPHVTVFSQRWLGRAANGPEAHEGLVIGRARVAKLRPDQVGRPDQVDATARAVIEAVIDAGVTAEAVRIVLVKGQSLRPGDVVRRSTPTGSLLDRIDLGMGPDGAVSWANDASTLGVAVALGEVARHRITPERIHRDATLRSRVAVVSSAGDKDSGEVVVLARRRDTLSPVDIGIGMSEHLVDTGGLLAAMADAGLRPVGMSDTGRGLEHTGRTLVQVLAKFSAPRDGQLFGNQLSGVHDEAVHTAVKVAGSAVIASITGLNAIFVSGGEHTCHGGPPGGGPLAVLVRRADADTRREELL